MNPRKRLLTERTPPVINAVILFGNFNSDQVGIVSPTAVKPFSVLFGNWISLPISPASRTKPRILIDGRKRRFVYYLV